MKLDKNIPIPNKAPKAGNIKYDWAEMNVGDSHLKECEYSQSMQSSIKRSAAKWAEKHNPTAEFTTRKVQGGIRIWRIK